MAKRSLDRIAELELESAGLSREMMDQVMDQHLRYCRAFTEMENRLHSVLMGETP